MNCYKSKFKLILILFFAGFLLFNTSFGAPKKELLNDWIAFNPLSTKSINYPIWQKFLKHYVISQKNQTLINYKKVTNKDKQSLSEAINRLENIQIDQYNRNEQLAYWINLYNMETVYLILQHYPVKSIKDITDGFFSFGPWDMQLLTVDGKKLSLNNIEHGIIRAIWNDPRIHAAVNCASISCPNLQIQAYQGKLIDQQLNQSFSEFINSEKGVLIKNNKLYLSEIFNWYGIDFGNSKKDILRFVIFYANSKLKNQLKQYNQFDFMPYNWNLNEVN
ncbi:DUF547 domain-containing protein [Thiotrichales bacterium 19S3-7]|nr:DUF547 domain-containing protein [Thiotrichales bacterium 19S3-7]MCF6801388.1 DUF547 domain-containing protein [Thiotrichales bacterium 19S3-11]